MKTQEIHDQAHALRNVGAELHHLAKAAKTLGLMKLWKSLCFKASTVILIGNTIDELASQELHDAVAEGHERSATMLEAALAGSTLAQRSRKKGRKAKKKSKPK